MRTGTSWNKTHDDRATSACIKLGARQTNGAAYQMGPWRPPKGTNGRPPCIKWGFVSKTIVPRSRTTVSRTAGTTVPRSRTTVSRTAGTTVPRSRTTAEKSGTTDGTNLHVSARGRRGLACIEWKLAKQPPNSVERSSAGVPPSLLAKQCSHSLIHKIEGAAWRQRNRCSTEYVVLYVSVSLLL